MVRRKGLCFCSPFRSADLLGDGATYPSSTILVIHGAPSSWTADPSSQRAKCNHKKGDRISLFFVSEKKCPFFVGEARTRRLGDNAASFFRNRVVRCFRDAENGSFSRCCHRHREPSPILWTTATISRTTQGWWTIKSSAVIGGRTFE